MLFSQCATRPQPSSPAMVERSPGQLLNHSAQSLVLMFFLLLQDYLGGCIVFVATVTALTAASVSCRRHYEATTSPSASASPSPFETYAVTKSPSELRPSPSLVGLAINYTLLVPIYLNWVVKLLADMEMYAGSVERIAHYAQGQDADADADADVDADAWTPVRATIAFAVRGGFRLFVVFGFGEGFVLVSVWYLNWIFCFPANKKGKQIETN